MTDAAALDYSCMIAASGKAAAIAVVRSPVSPRYGVQAAGHSGTAGFVWQYERSYRFF
jgi:hypothetical protein